LLSFTSDTISVYDLMDAMTANGWFLQFQLSSNCTKANLHMTIAKAHKETADQFLIDLQIAVNQVKKKSLLKKLSSKATVKAAVALANNLSPDNFSKLGK